MCWGSLVRIRVIFGVGGYSTHRTLFHRLVGLFNFGRCPCRAFAHIFLSLLFLVFAFVSCVLTPACVSTGRPNLRSRSGFDFLRYNRTMQNSGSGLI